MTNVKAQIEIEVIDHVSAATAKAEQAIQSLAQAELQAANATKVLAAASLEKAQTAAAGATSVEGLARADLQAANASRQLARAEIQAAKASATLATNARNASAATASLSPAAGTAIQAVGRITQAQKLQGLGMAQNINLVSELAMGFGNMSPKTRELGLAFATAGNNSFALASALGPMGVVVGTVVGLAPSLIKMFTDAGSAADGAASSMDGARRAFLAMVDAQRQGREQMESSERLLEGEATTEEIDDAIAVTRQLQAKAQRRESAALASVSPLERATVERALQEADPTNISHERMSEIAEEARDIVEIQTGHRPDRVGGGDMQGVMGALNRVNQIRGASFDEGAENRAASTGTRAAAERLRLLEERRQVAAAREQREAFEQDVQDDGTRVSVAEAEFNRQIELSGASPQVAQRLRADLAAARGVDGETFRSRDLDAVGGNRGAITTSADRVRQFRSDAQERQDAYRAQQLEEFEAERLARADTTADVPGIGERASRPGGPGNETFIVPATRSDEAAAARSPFTGTINMNVNGQYAGQLQVTEGEISQVELDAEAAGPDGFGAL